MAALYWVPQLGTLASEPSNWSLTADVPASDGPPIGGSTCVFNTTQLTRCDWDIGAPTRVLMGLHGGGGVRLIGDAIFNVVHPYNDGVAGGGVLDVQGFACEIQTLNLEGTIKGTAAGSITLVGTGHTQNAQAIDVPFGFELNVKPAGAGVVTYDAPEDKPVFPSLFADIPAGAELNITDTITASDPCIGFLTVVSGLVTCGSSGRLCIGGTTAQYWDATLPALVPCIEMIAGDPISTIDRLLIELPLGHDYGYYTNGIVTTRSDMDTRGSGTMPNVIFRDGIDTGDGNMTMLSAMHWDFQDNVDVSNWAIKGHTGAKISINGNLCDISWFTTDTNTLDLTVDLGIDGVITGTNRLILDSPSTTWLGTGSLTLETVSQPIKLSDNRMNFDIFIGGTHTAANGIRGAFDVLSLTIDGSAFTVPFPIDTVGTKTADTMICNNFEIYGNGGTPTITTTATTGQIWNNCTITDIDMQGIVSSLLADGNTDGGGNTTYPPTGFIFTGTYPPEEPTTQTSSCKTLGLGLGLGIIQACIAITQGPVVPANAVIVDGNAIQVDGENILLTEGA